MNLFLAAWKLSPQKQRITSDCFDDMHEIFPQLDSKTYWSEQLGQAFLAGMHTATQFCGPRQYVASSRSEVVAYDGCLVDLHNDIEACDANQLAHQWKTLPSRLEGQFAVVRATDETLEVLTDPLGMLPVYWAQDGESWLISNNIRLISIIVTKSGFDLNGACLFLGCGYVGKDGTLIDDINVLPGGQRWTWTETNNKPAKHFYFSSADITPRSWTSVCEPPIQKLADDLCSMSQTLFDNYKQIKCALTGGRDSRLIASTLIQGDLPAQYFTAGNPNSLDCRISAQIAKEFNLSYRQHESDSAELERRWNEAVDATITQHDGLMNLWTANSMLQTRELNSPLQVTLWGGAGELARGYLPPATQWRVSSLDQVCSVIAQRHGRPPTGTLFKPQVTQSREAYIRDFAIRYLDQGFSLPELPDLFYLFEIIPRWNGSRVRRLASVVDRFAPFCTRPFVEASFSVPVLQRHVEPLHYGVIKHLVPKLHEIPFEKEPWRNQNPRINALIQFIAQAMPTTLRSKLKRKFRKNNFSPKQSLQVSVLEAQLPSLRKVCLDQSTSPLWDLINRTEFERITSATFPAQMRLLYIEELYKIYTMFCYVRTIH